MLYKNTMPLPYRRTAEVIEKESRAPEDAALRALAGMFCAVCDQPLSAQDRQGRYGTEKHTGFTCCGRAHCPYCGLSHKDRCPHLIAYRTSGDWRIAGLPELSEQKLPAPPPLVEEALLDYSDAQKKAAWGKALPLTEGVYGPGFRRCVVENISGSDLVNCVMRPHHEQRVSTQSADNLFYFSQTPDAAAERLDRALTRDLPGGFDRLREHTPPGAEWVTGTIAIDAELQAIAFSPCGTRLAVLADQSGYLYRIDGDSPALLARFTPSGGKPGKVLDYVSAAFSPDGGCLLLKRAVVDSVDPFGGLADRHTEIRAADTGTLIAEFGEPGTIPQETGEISAWQDTRREMFLHGGRTLLTARGRTLRLYRTEALATSAKPAVILNARAPLSHLAVAADGETFATALDRFVLLWRVPREALDSPEGRR